MGPTLTTSPPPAAPGGPVVPGAADRADGAFPADMPLTLRSRRPAVLPDETLRVAAGGPVPAAPPPAPHLAGRAPAASIVIVTINNLPFTKLCLGSLLENTARDAHDYEVIVVDNGSSDGTPQYLRAVEKRNEHVRVILNASNRGFAGANNQGLAAARGDVLVLLNNDTVVPPGWLEALLAHAREGRVGLVGAVTNRIGNEAEVEADYRTYGEFVGFARRRAAEKAGRSFDIPMPAMFCLAMRRDVFEKIGPLDERFEVGLLEDDDYARRAHDAGYATVCAEDVFVHHFGQASFGGLVATGEYNRLLAANQRRYEEKWGEPWKPYGRSVKPSYARLAEEIRAVVGDLLPRGVVVAVVSRGDEELVDLGDRKGWHFPRTDDGTYAGHYPADGADAVAQLERLRALGAEYLLIPATALWWLDHYAELAEHLRKHFDLVFKRDDLCVIYSLTEAPAGGRLAESVAPPPGSADYRAFVGPADKYDLVAASQFALLARLGLREHHFLLDVGCGSLRAGRLFIPYLLPDRYYGIEPETWLIKTGFRLELGDDIGLVKRPSFSHDRDFTLTTFDRPFDFVLAQSIFSHASPRQIVRCLSQAAQVLKPRGIFAATYFEGDVDYAGDDWVYPGCVTYRFESMAAFAREQGLRCDRLDWPHPNGQQWLAFTRPLAEPHPVPPELLKGGRP